jgi:hypothetical protein
MKGSVVFAGLGASLLVSTFAFAFQPTLSNEDGREYKYELQCGGSTTHSSISGNTTQTLSSGCKLVITGAGAAKLADDMRCKIKNSTLDCS